VRRSAANAGFDLCSATDGALADVGWGDLYSIAKSRKVFIIAVRRRLRNALKKLSLIFPPYALARESVGGRKPI